MGRCHVEQVQWYRYCHHLSFGQLRFSINGEPGIWNLDLVSLSAILVIIYIVYLTSIAASTLLS